MCVERVSGPVAAIIVAAGASTRLGMPKQLVLLAGETLLQRAVRVAGEGGCAPVIVVLGCRAEEIVAACPLPGAQVVLNEDWARGMAGSIAAGIRALESSQQDGSHPEPVRGAVVLTCDQPAITPEHLRRLYLADGSGTTDEPVASAYSERRGVPAYLPARLFPELLALEGDSGARDLLKHARSVELPGGGLDVDTPADLRAARAVFKRAGSSASVQSR